MSLTLNVALTNPEPCIRKSETVQDKLRQFHMAFKHPLDEEYPEVGHTIDMIKELRHKLINEEYKELIDAIENKEAEEVLKELCDLVYVCVGFAVSYGWNFDVAFNRVHHSNMSKLDSNGKPVYREDGKVAKSEGYQPPSLRGLV